MSLGINHLVSVHTATGLSMYKCSTPTLSCLARTESHSKSRPFDDYIFQEIIASSFKILVSPAFRLNALLLNYSTGFLVSQHCLR
jgi:hypothetical protein